MRARDSEGVARRPAISDAIEDVALDRHVATMQPESAIDAVVREEPLGIEVGGTRLAVVMRTPGHDAELALGLLLAERVIEDASDVVALHAASLHRNPDDEDNVVRVLLREWLVVDLERLRRNLYALSSC